MAPDALIRKYFAVVVLALLGLAAWLGARGVTALLDARLAAGTAASTRAPAAPATASANERSAAPILARNPFDSVTGPLDRRAVPAPSAIPGTHTEPLTAPACSDVEVRIVTEADDPRQSRAALQTKGDAAAHVYGVGDHVGTRVVAYIGFNPARRSPAVWLSDDTGLCQSLLFDPGMDASAPVLAAPPPTPPADSTAEALRGIHPHGADSVIIDRSAVNQILSDGSRLMPDAAILFEQSDGEVLGVRVFQIAPDSVLYRLGVRSGDRIESVGGVHVSTRDAALQGYQALRGSDPVEIRVTRQGKPATIRLEVR